MDIVTDEELMKAAKEHAPNQDASYHEYSFWLMKHMQEVREKQKQIQKQRFKL